MVKRFVGSVVALGAGVLALLGAGDRTELFDRAKDWWSWLGLGAILARVDPEFLLVVVAIVVGLWAWDVPQRLWRQWTHSGPRPSPDEVIEEGTKRAVREAAVRRLSELIAQHVRPSFEALDKALRASTVPISHDRLLPALIRTYEMLLADHHSRMESLERLIRSAKEDATTVPVLVDSTALTVWRYFAVCDLVVDLRLVPDVLLNQPREFIDWWDANERLKAEVLAASYQKGLERFRESDKLQPATMPTEQRR